MIVIFPMLVSQSVSENVIPGIAKTVENYLIVNATNYIMAAANFKGVKYTKHGIEVKVESESLLEVNPNKRDELTGKGGNKGNKPQSDEEFKNTINQMNQTMIDLSKDISQLKGQMTTQSNSDRKREIDQLINDKRKQIEKIQKQELDAKKQRQSDIKFQMDLEKRKEEELKQQETKATAKITTSDFKSISLEPTYMYVDIIEKSGGVRREFVGIKVIPYRVKSRIKLSRLILHDVQLKSINAAMVSFGRKITRWFWSLYDKWTGRLLKGGLTVSGDPRRDIVMARTGQRGMGIIVLDKNEDIDERFLQNFSKLNRLFKMGWNNIIVTDDVTRTAYFCMQAYKGVCNAISYAMMYNQLGQLKVYDSLEDAKRQNSSLFKISTRASKVFSEWVTEYRLAKYIKEDK